MTGFTEQLLFIYIMDTLLRSIYPYLMHTRQHQINATELEAMPIDVWIVYSLLQTFKVLYVI